MRSRNILLWIALLSTTAGLGACHTAKKPAPADRDVNVGQPASDETPPASGGGGECGGSVYDSGFCCETGYSFSRCGAKARYVLPAGRGARDGSDWANALRGLPGALERDTVYWLGAGSYGAYTFDDAASGSAGITLRKATAEMHGTDSGWSAGFGNGPAVFGPLTFATDRYTMDGGESGGVVVTYSGPMGGTSSAVYTDGDNIVLRNLEIDGGVSIGAGTQTAGACNAVRSRGNNLVIDRCDLHDAADDGIEIHDANHVKVLRSNIHSLPACGTDGECSGPCFNGHSDGIELISSNDVEIVGTMVYDILSTGAIIAGGSDTQRNITISNSILYTPDTGLTADFWNVQGLYLYNNVVWGRTQGSRYGGLAIGSGMKDVHAYNNIFVNINFTHHGSSYDPSEHHLDYNLFGDLDTSEYPGSANDLVADPRFAGVPLSGNGADHKRSELSLDDFMPASSEAIDTGTASNGVPAYDILGEERPQGPANDRGVFETTP